MDANTGSKGGQNTTVSTINSAHSGLETSRTEGNVPMESGTSSQGETSAGQQRTPAVGSTLPTLNPMAASFTPSSQTAATAALPSTSASDTPTVRPASPHPSTPPSLESLARKLEELKSKGLSNVERLEEIHHQRRQLLSHMTAAKAEIDRLEGELKGEESIEGSQDILNRLRELGDLREWVGNKWIGLGEEVTELETEIAVPGKDEFWGL